MSYLIREGMRPITEGFAEAWRDYVHSPVINPNDKPLKGSGVTREQFHEALDALGIEGAEGLGEFLGLSTRQARNIMNNPENILGKHLLKLRRRYMKIEGPLRVSYKDAEQVSGAYPQDEDYKADADAAGMALLDFTTRCSALSADSRRLDSAARIGSELRVRALIEGYLELSEEDRAALMRVLCAMLATGGSARGELVARLVRRYDCSENPFTAADTLALMVSGDEADKWLYPYEDEFLSASNVILDEYSGSDQSA